jgi:secondary thiamine-phosphate synthase enzyme
LTDLAALASLASQAALDSKGPLDFRRKLIPRGVWRHDAQDGNGDAHLKSGLVGPSEAVSLIEGELGLSTWQNIFFCEFDGPRRERTVVVTVISYG